MRNVINPITGKFNRVLSKIDELRNVNDKRKEILSTSEPTPGVVLRVEVISHLLVVGEDVTIIDESPYDGVHTVSTIVDDDFFEVLL